MEEEFDGEQLNLIQQLYVMDLHELSGLIKESQEELLLSDTQVEIPGPFAELQKQLELLQEERASLQYAKSVATKQAAKVINDSLYQTLILLNEENMQLRNYYRALMKDRQLKKENYYGEPSNNSSMRGSAAFSINSSVKLEHLTTPKHCYQRKMVSPQIEERKSYCPARKKSTFSRASLQNRNKVKPTQAPFKSDNVFLNLLGLIVQEEKQAQREMLKQLANPNTDCGISLGDFCHISDVEKHLQHTYTKIQKMVELMRLYQDKLDKSTKECDQLQLVITQFSDAKKRLSSIFQKISSIPKLSLQIQTKRQYINQNKTIELNSKSLSNLQLLLKVLDYKEGSELQRVITLGKESAKLIVDPRQSKILQVMDSIRLGRTKFKQIYNIYMQRIQALEVKLSSLK